jgi:hypothetical protein
VLSKITLLNFHAPLARILSITFCFSLSARQDFLPAGSEQSASNEAEIQRPDLVTYVVVGNDQ